MDPRARNLTELLVIFRPFQVRNGVICIIICTRQGTYVTMQIINNIEKHEATDIVPFVFMLHMGCSGRMKEISLIVCRM